MSPPIGSLGTRTFSNRCAVGGRFFLSRFRNSWDKRKLEPIFWSSIRCLLPLCADTACRFSPTIAPNWHHRYFLLPFFRSSDILHALDDVFMWSIPTLVKRPALKMVKPPEIPSPPTRRQPAAIASRPKTPRVAGKRVGRPSRSWPSRLKIFQRPRQDPSRGGE